MSKIVCLSKEFLLELLNTHCFANLPEDTDIELLDGEEKNETQFRKSLKNTSCLDYSKLCSNCYSNYEDNCCMENCEFYNHNECPVVYVNGLLVEKDKTISDLEAKLAQKDEEITKRLRLQDDGFLEERKKMEQQISDLEAKLAEKDQDIEDYQKLITDICNKYCVSSLKKLPIEFAIAELEKVKKLTTDVVNESFGELCLSDVKEICDNQIKQLKGGGK